MKTKKYLKRRFVVQDLKIASRTGVIPKTFRLTLFKRKRENEKEASQTEL